MPFHFNGYTNMHDLNLDWVTSMIKNIEDAESNTAADAESAAASAESALASKEAAAASEQNAAASEQNAADSATAANLSADRIEEKARQIDQNTARIDNIVAQGTPTEGNAELIDARVTYQNVTYETAGGAIRAQAADLADALVKATGYDGPGNLLDVLQIVDTANVSAMTGRIEDGIHITYDNSQSSTIRALEIASNSFSLKKGVRYILKVNSSIARGTLFESIRLDIRNAENTSEVFYAELTENGGSFIAADDMNVVIMARIAAGYNADLILYPALYEYKNTIDKRIDLLKNNEIDNIENILSENLRGEPFADQGVSFVNNLDGSITINGTPAATIGARITGNPIYLEAGETYVFASYNDKNVVPSMTAFRMDIRYNDTGTVVQAENFYNGAIITITESRYYFMGLRVQNGYVMDDVTIRPVLYNIKSLPKTDGRIKVCAFNVGNFSKGASGNPAGNAEMYNNFIDTFKKANANVYAFCEWDEFWNSEKTILSETVFGKLKPYKTNAFRKNAGDYVAEMNYSDFPFYSETITYYADGESRHYTDNVMIINGKPVHFINTHLPFSSVTKRREDIQKLKDYITTNNLEYYIVAGDFNMGTGETGSDQARIIEIARDDVSMLESDGAVSVQGGFYGLMNYDYFMNTFENPDENISVRPFDNIVVSPNMTIKNVEVIPTEASDHYALTAEIEIK